MPSEKLRYLKNQKPKKVLGDYSEEKAALFADFAHEPGNVLLELLEAAYDSMTPPQRRDVFGERLDHLRTEVFDGEHLVREIEAFRDESHRGEFYAPFDINSKNCTYIPDETRGGLIGLVIC